MQLGTFTMMPCCHFFIYIERESSVSILSYLSKLWIYEFSENSSPSCVVVEVLRKYLGHKAAFMSICTGASQAS